MEKPDPGSNGTAIKTSNIPRLTSQSDSRDLEKADPLPKSPTTLPPVTTTGNRFLTASEWAKLAHGLGAVHDGSEKHSLVHPTSWVWPPKGLPSGLYKDVIMHETYYMYKFHLISGFRWALLILQILIGATLTALGSVGTKSDTAITTIAAINTFLAGLLALIHNSGLPDRYRMDKIEFGKVADYIKELLDTGVIKNGQSVDELLTDCFSRYCDAKKTVQANMPSQYTASAAPPAPAAAANIAGSPSAPQMTKPSH